MKKHQYKRITNALFITSGFVVFFLVWFSFEAISETENWVFLDFDFKNKGGVISSYGTLLAAILSFITILFILLDLSYQRRLKSQEEEDKENDNIQKSKDFLNIIQLFIDRLISNSTSQSIKSNVFVESEKENPTQMNMISFYPNTFSKLILDIDRISIFEALRRFKPSKDWKAIYVDLFKIVDFYDKSFEELQKKFKIHLDKKYSLSSEIGIQIDKFIDVVSDKRNEIIGENREIQQNLLEDPFFIILNNCKEKAEKITKERNNIPQEELIKRGDPASMEVWRKDILLPFFDDTLKQWNIIKSDPYQFDLILPISQNLIRQIDKLTKDSLDYAIHIENYTKEYFAEESKYIKRLKEVSDDINNVLLLEK